ncbi:T9SS type A sorting domain-containing protein [candidate division WOR-3 bacterium]|nr:T9SS type A sorting domain-containing protein [candidate division WOR-3 bacterium]
MAIFLIINLLIGQFGQKFYLDRGTEGRRGRILVCDSDRDSQIELIFGYYENLQEKIVVYELYPDSNFHLEAVIDTMTNEAWDVGDFDNDGFFDLVIGGDFGLPVVGPQIFESPDSFSYPTQEVWRDTAGFPLVTPICTYDIDQDGLPEIVKVCGYYTDLDIYESIGDNLYEKITEITTASTHTSSSTLTFGDFDLDGQNEFVFGYTGGEYSIFECIGNNSYQEIILQTLSTFNIKDCFSVPDADEDGKLEFAVKGFIVPTARINAFIFEAIGDNTYEIIKTFDLFGGHNSYYGGYSDAGDVDGDSIPEIVLEGCQNVYIIKSAGNDSFYVWETLPGHTSGSCVRVYDIDNNGLAEIVISGNDETRIYEYDPGGVEEARSQIQEARLEIYPNPFIQTLNIKFQNQTEKVVSVKVYDVSGRLVKNLYTGIVNGNHTLIWSGNDDYGRIVAQGIYFMRVENVDSGETSCMKVLKIK